MSDVVYPGYLAWSGWLLVHGTPMQRKTLIPNDIGHRTKEAGLLHAFAELGCSRIAQEPPCRVQPRLTVPPKKLTFP